MSCDSDCDSDGVKSDSDGVDSGSRIRKWIPCDRKRPFVRFLVWVYIDTDGDRNVTEGATLAHNQ